jgi:hypothetical protein
MLSQDIRLKADLPEARHKRGRSTVRISSIHDQRP